MPRIFRPATEDDAEAVHALIQAAFAEYIDTIPVPPGALGDTVDDTRKAISEGHTILVFIGDIDLLDGKVEFNYEKLVGTAHYEPRDGYLYVGRVAVHPDYRRHGIGKALMEHIERVAPTLGYTRLYLGTRISMPGNLAFYERLGYRIVKTEPHPRGPDENVWFEKQLENVDTAETLLQTVIGFLHELPGKSLDEVIYCPLPHELGEDNIDVPLLYIGGEVKMRFRNLAPRYLGWDSNTGWGGAYSLRIALQTRFRPEFLEERVANQLSIWSRFVGTPLRHIDVLGWEGVPYICRFGFDAGEIYIGSGYQFAFGDGDDLIIATEEGWQSLDLKAPNIESPALLAHLSSGQNPKSEIRNPKSI